MFKPLMCGFQPFMFGGRFMEFVKGSPVKIILEEYILSRQNLGPKRLRLSTFSDRVTWIFHPMKLNSKGRG